MQQALTRQQWDADLLGDYDSAAQREFPLETQLWRYLRVLHAPTSASERETASRAVQKWLDAEALNPTQNSRSWRPYLRQRWAALQPRTDGALADGTTWLNELLGRYQPLPAPLLA